MPYIKQCMFGLGLFADRDYQEGYVIGIVNGPVVTREQATDRAVEPKPGVYIETDEPWVFINHSCRSNVRLLGERVIVAERAIVTGEELFFDYRNFIHDNWSMNCECGNSNCRRLIQAHH